MTDYPKLYGPEPLMLSLLRDSKGLRFTDPNGGTVMDWWHEQQEVVADDVMGEELFIMASLSATAYYVGRLNGLGLIDMKVGSADPGTAVITDDGLAVLESWEKENGEVERPGISSTDIVH